MPFDVHTVTALVTTVGVPALIVDVLLKADLTADALAVMAGASLAVHAAFLLIGWGIVRLMGKRVSTYLPSLVFANNGNMGLPLCLFAFGEQGLALAIAFFVVGAVLMFTVGVGLAAGEVNARMLLRTPLLWAVAVALTLLALDVSLPRWIGNTVHLAGAFTIPLMLITLGVSLARLKVSSLKTSLVFSVLRLGMGFTVGWAVALALGLEGVALGVVVIESALPVAVFNYLWAVRYDNHPEEVAGMVLLSTTLAFFALPFMLSTVM
ncbi:MAG: AEC family transporter [Rhodospirillaceae bacterium]